MTATSTSRPSLPTYTELKLFFRHHLIREGKSGGVADNYVGTLNKWVRLLRLGEDAPPGGELNGAFQKHLALFVDRLSEEGRSGSTLSSYSSHVRALKDFVDALSPNAELPPTFHEALTELIRTSGSTPQGFWRRHMEGTIGGDIRILGKWCKAESQPTKATLHIVARLEHLLSAPEGALMSRLPLTQINAVVRPTGQTDFGRRLSAARRKEHRYGYWSPRLDEQVNRLGEHMSAPIEADDLLRNAVWTHDGTDKLPSLNITKHRLRLFFGFCGAPVNEEKPFVSGLGMPPEKMSLALLSDRSFVEPYIEFMRLRAGGVYTTGTVSFINFVTSLLRPKTGYSYQQPAFAADVDDPAAKADWQAWCVRTRDRLYRMLKSLERQRRIVPGRDPVEAVRHIVEAPRPIDFLHDALAKYERDLSLMFGARITKAMAFRDFLLFGLMVVNPLRSRQFSIMEFDRHLFRRSEGSWWLRFKRNDFKNRQSLDKDYQVRVAPEWWSRIERYKEEFRPLLIGADSCRHVFLPSPRCGQSSTADFTPKMTIGGIIRKVTFLYVKDCSGCGSHAIRHIIATDIIKANPPGVGIAIAAAALHDKFKTVEQAYKHVNSHEEFEPVNHHYSASLREASSRLGKAGAA